MSSFIKFAGGLLLILALIGCGGGVAYTLGPNYRVTSVRHFSSEEEMIYDSIDAELKRELQGLNPSAGTKTWREYWEWRVSLWRQHKAQKYEDYLYRRRKELALEEVKQL